MQHNESNTRIYFTRDYSAFKNITGNRDLNPAKIKRIIRDIENGLDMLRYCPIIVNEQMEIIDGQHRYFVSKKVGSNVYYVISKNELDITEIAAINSNTERWKYKDFLHCYMTKKVDDYLTLDYFMKQYSVPIGTAIKLLQYGSINADRKNEEQTAKVLFESGKFKAKYLVEASELMELVHRFKAYPKFLQRSFIQAIRDIKLAGKANMDELLEKFHTDRSPLDRCVTSKDYINALEQIYNYRKKDRHIIF